ncbi:MAG: polymer-forming cytoskeletal protein [Pseudomonadota bacterium]
MLGNKEKGGFAASNATTLVSRDTEIVGDIHFNGNLDIEGTVRGNIIATAGKDAVVRVVDKGLVEGEIHAPSVIINGTVTGDVHSSKHLELASKARVKGSVHYALVEMAIGAEVNGSLTHSSTDSKVPSKQDKHEEVAPVPSQQITSINS